MPAPQDFRHELPQVEEFGQLLLQLLHEAEAIKDTSDIEPPLTSSDFEDLKPRVTTIFGNLPLNKRVRQYAMTEGAARAIFNQLVKTTEISSPDFVKIWNLLDILSILCDNELCDAALVFWLVEELLDSQTTDGCAKIFDFLESRRERLTAKHFKLKHLVILRSCNELLRRLSRAQDTSFCGRVFIFLFQSFPLGDKSSVNLRGEYHVENVTTYDNEAVNTAEKMDVDETSSASATARERATPIATKGRDAKDDTIDMDTFYPIFWALQDIFSQPKKLFDPDVLEQFKKSLSIAVKAMKAHTVRKGNILPKSSDESKQFSKKKSGEKEEDEKGDLSNAFNPKYLTSRDLFELEISDISFQRHVLVQALIVMDFLISLSGPEKEKLAGITKKNQSVIYQDHTLSREDTQWALDMRRTIQEFLIEGPEGAFFYRMVESILSRDKNWVRWKMESCPPIELPPLPAESFVSSKSAIQRIANKRPKISHGASMDLSFLQPPDPKTMWDKYKDPKRYKLPDLKTYEKKIANAKFDVEMATNDEERAEAEEVLAAQTWRAMRIAASQSIAKFDKVEDYRSVDAMFKDPVEDEEEEDAGPKAPLPKDTRSLVISGPSGVGKTSLINELLKKYPGVFKLVPRLTSRKQADGEVRGAVYDFVSKADINSLMDRDQIIEFEDIDEHTYATSRTKIDSIEDSGKVPVLRLSPVSAQSIKDWDYPARFVFISPPNVDELQNRLRNDPSLTDDKISACVKEAEEQLKDAGEGSLFEATIMNDKLEDACASLGAFVYGGEEVQGGGDLEMDDDAAAADSNNMKEEEDENGDQASAETAPDTKAPEPMETG
ncbi:hypothetical protein MKZ38_010763 [Zalerion maritima]|uniref:Guanylate kinase-like domain-containing protein n=1 Tax=Zalerion maritima TaxID=339359 RepID=A0AAD5RY61_9PEZI|nr:hypothetical protein MKZ38_010763 [Zalerion maritima]